MNSNAIFCLFALLAFSGCVTSPETGIVPSNSKLDVFPNPTIYSVVIQVNNNGATGSIKILDTEGQEFFKESVPNGENRYQVDLQTAVEGTYHVVLELDHEVITSKFIKL